MNERAKKKRESRIRTVKKFHDKVAKPLDELNMGQSVFFQHLEGQKWKLGEVIGLYGPRTYELKGPNGGTYRRNRVHLRHTLITPKIRDQSPVMIPTNKPSAPELSATLTNESNTQGISEPHNGAPKNTKRKTSKDVNNSPRKPVQANTEVCGQSIATDRPKRATRAPTKFKDYVLNQVNFIVK